MRLDASGQPAHTRLLELELFQHTPDTFSLRSQILDLRKMGFVPMGGSIQNAGVIHQMTIDADVDATTRTIRSLSVAQPRVAFEATAETGGECCRDPSDRLRALEGERLDEAFARRVSRVFGGGLGCSHLLTLGQTIGRALPFALEAEAGRRERRGARRAPGERLFKRSVYIDGLSEPDACAMELVVQQCDLHERPLAQVADPLERLERQDEVRVHATVDMVDFAMTLHTLEGAERSRGPATMASARWQTHSAALAPLVGRRVMPGLGGALFGLLGERSERRLLLDALLHLGPGFLQCIAALSDDWSERPARGSPVASMGGREDACYMWRSDGVLARRRQRFLEEGAAATRPVAASAPPAPAADAPLPGARDDA